MKDTIVLTLPQICFIALVFWILFGFHSSSMGSEVAGGINMGSVYSATGGGKRCSSGQWVGERENVPSTISTEQMHLLIIWLLLSPDRILWSPMIIIELIPVEQTRNDINI